MSSLLSVIHFDHFTILHPFNDESEKFQSANMNCLKYPVHLFSLPKVMLKCQPCHNIISLFYQIFLYYKPLCNLNIWFCKKFLQILSLLVMKSTFRPSLIRTKLEFKRQSCVSWFLFLYIKSKEIPEMGRSALPGGVRTPLGLLFG